MKKLMLTLCLGFGLLLSYAGQASAGASIDQQQTVGSGSYAIYNGDGEFAQTFKPTYSILDRVELELTNVIGAKTLSVSIKHRTGLVWDAGVVATISNQTISDGWNTFDFADFTVGTTSNDSYKIIVNCPDSDTQWKYKGSPSIYDRGYAIWQDNDKPDVDYNFKTWGTDPVEILGENTQATNQSSDVSATGTAPSENVSSSIAKPTGLLAAYSSEVAKKGVNLFWKASTTADITGYNVYRSIVKGKSYSKIGQVDKAKIELVDPAAEASKTYYYIVRAYKAAEESASSNEASIIVPADAAPISPQNFKVVSFTDSRIKVAWDKNPEANIVRYTLTISDKETPTGVTLTIPAETVSADTNEFVFSGLAPDKEYRITIYAYGTAESIPSEVIQKTASTIAETKASGFEMTLLTWILAGAGVLLIGLLVLLILRRRRMTKRFR